MVNYWNQFTNKTDDTTIERYDKLLKQYIRSFAKIIQVAITSS